MRRVAERFRAGPVWREVVDENIRQFRERSETRRDDVHVAIGATEGEWHQQRMQLESAFGSTPAQNGGQQGIIDEQAGMLLRAEKVCRRH